MSRIGICVINWLNYNETIECLSEIIYSFSARFSVVVLDNGSQNESFYEIEKFLINNTLSNTKLFQYKELNAATYLTKSGCELTLFKSDENLGFAGGANICIDFLLTKRSDFVLLLNSDARIESAEIQMLCQVANERSALVCPLIKNEDDEISFSGRNWPYLLFSINSLSPQSSEPSSSAFVEGSLAILPITFLEKKIQFDGYVFDERFFLYCEDVDLGLRARDLGFSSLVVNAVVAKHKGSASSGGLGNPTAYYYITRNRILLVKKWLNTSTRILFYSYYILSRICLLPIRHSTKKGRATNRAVIFGLLDGFASRYGKTTRTL